MLAIIHNIIKIYKYNNEEVEKNIKFGETVMAYFEFKEDCEKFKCVYQFDSSYGMFNLEKLNTKDGIHIKKTFLLI